MYQFIQTRISHYSNKMDCELKYHKILKIKPSYQKHKAQDIKYSNIINNKKSRQE